MKEKDLCKTCVIRSECKNRSTECYTTVVCLDYVKPYKLPTHKEILTDILKEGWISNYKAITLLCSSSAGRTIRKIRANPPRGLVVMDRVVKKPTYHLQFHLMKVISQGLIDRQAAELGKGY